MMERPSARIVRPGEMLAMHPQAIHSGPQGMFWLFGGGVTPNERRGNVAIVHVRGALDHHSDSWDDNYESILLRVKSAMTGDDGRDCDASDRKWSGDEAESDPESYTPPSCVVLCIDSPGGVVSGLNECVFALQRMKKEYGIPLHAYVNELAASAAYALSCACDKVLCPPSAIIGSIGVISTMVSQASADKRGGFDVRLLTSGARKADGHLHAPITDAAVNAEQGRVDKLAQAFFKIASKARGLSVDEVAGFQAGIYLGKDAVKRKLADEVVSFDDAILALSTDTDEPGTQGGGDEFTQRVKNPLDLAAKTRSLAKGLTNNVTPGVTKMSLKIVAQIKTLKTALAAESDPAKMLAISANLTSALATYKKTKHVEHTEEEDDGEDDKDDEDDGEDKKKGDDDEDDDSEESSKESKEKAEEEGSSKDAKSEEAEEKEESEEKQATSALRLLEAATGRKGSAALGAAMARFSQLDRVLADTKALKATADKKERADLFQRAGRYVPKHLVAALKTQNLSAVRAFVEEAEKGSPMVNTEDGDLIRPKVTNPGTEESLPKETLAMIDQAVNACGLSDPKAFRKTLVESHLKAHSERMKSAMNGAGRL